MIKLKNIWPLFKQAFSQWSEDRAPSMGAALAYYTAFSIAPLLMIAIAVAGLFFGRDAAQEAMVSQLGGLTGEAGATAIDDILGSTEDFGTGILALTIGIGALLLGATTAFVELQDDLDRIWRAPPRVGSGILNFIRARMLSLGMVLFIGFLLTVSLALSAGVAALGDVMFGGAEAVLHVLTFLVSFAVITALFAMIYKVLPNAETSWRDALVGAAITALLFELGKYLIGLYIGKSEVGTSFGAASPFVVLMLWIYYSTQIFLLGAEFTVAYSGKRKPGEAPAPATANVQAPANGATAARPAIAAEKRFARPATAASVPQTGGPASSGKLLVTALAVGVVIGAKGLSKKPFPYIR